MCRFYTLFLLTFFFIRSNAQEFQSRYLGIENGLSNNVVYAIHQDHNGFMWFGTYDGLNRYDGYGFKTFRNIIGDSTSLSSNNINTIDEDSFHRLWVGGQKEVNIYDPVTSTFHIPQYVFHNGAAKRNLSDNVIAIRIIEGQNALAGTQHNGLFYFENEKSGRQVPLNINGREIVDYYVSSIDYDAKRKIASVFIQNYGLYEFDLKKGSSSLITDTLKFATFIQRDRAGRTWIGTDHGLFLYDVANGKLSETYISVNRPVVNMCEDKNGIIWIATDGAGVWILNPGETKAKPLVQNPDGKSLISSNAVYTVYEDKDQRKWIGTLRGGVTILESSSPFKKVTYQPGDQNAVKNFIFSFLEDEPGKIWIGTDGAGLRLWDRVSNTYETFTYRDKDPSSISSNFIASIIKNGKNDIWIATWFGGVNRFNKRTGKFQRFPTFNTKNNSNSNNIWRLLSDSKGRLWAAAVRNGALFQFDYNQQKFIEFDNNLSELQSIVEDKKGNIWAGNYSELIRIDTLHKKHTVYQVGHPVRSIHEDRNGNFWIGTQEGGLMLFDRTSGKFRRYTTQHGLSNNTVLGILEDARGNLWMSTYNGLTQFNPSKNDWQVFSQADGLQSNQFSFNAAHKLKSGEMLFGGIRGFNVFDPLKISPRPLTSSIFLSGIQVSNEPVEKNPEYVSERNLDRVKHIVVPYDKAILTLDYLGLDYSDVSNVTYAYLLKGWDKQWNFVGANRSANYSRLREGTYEFQVKVSNRIGEWSDEYSLLTITILPPWYRSWWAYIGYALILASIIYLYTLYKNRQAKLQYQVQLANLEVQQEKELNEKKIAFFTNVSHEFRTPLALIINPVKDLLNRNKDSSEKAELQVVYRNSRRLLRLVDQLLLFKKADEQNDVLHLEKINVYHLSKEVFLCFVEQARSRKIKYELKCDNPELMVNGDLQKLEIALFNILSNAFKFTPDEGSIIFSIFDEGEKIKISILDTGSGIAPEEAPFLFERFAQSRRSKNKMGFGIGLYLVKTFIEAHGGTVSFKSKENAGTTFCIRLNSWVEPSKSEIEEIPKKSGIGISDRSGKELKDQSKTEIIGGSKAEIDDRPKIPGSSSPYLEEMTEEIEEPVNEKAGSLPVSELVTEKQTLLIIDDDNEIRHYLVSIFSEQYKILQAETGLTGLKIAKDQLPDLVISDIVMPDMDGLDLCKSLKEDSAFSHIPVILLTGTSSDEIQLKGIKNGADDYIKKPFDKDILIARVTAILKRKNILQQYFFNEITLGSAKYKVSPEYKEFIEKCMLIIEDRLLDDNFSIKVLAQEIGMSHSNLYKKIRVVSGQSVNSFIRFVRLKRAAELLISTEMNVNETATTVGIHSVKYFRTQFHQLFGLNPSDYIKKYRKPFHNNQTLEEKIRK